MGAWRNIMVTVLHVFIMLALVGGLAVLVTHLVKSWWNVFHR